MDWPSRGRDVTFVLFCVSVLLPSEKESKTRGEKFDRCWFADYKNTHTHTIVLLLRLVSSNRRLLRCRISLWLSFSKFSLSGWLSVFFSHFPPQNARVVVAVAAFGLGETQNLQLAS